MAIDMMLKLLLRIVYFLLIFSPFSFAIAQNSIQDEYVIKQGYTMHRVKMILNENSLKYRGVLYEVGDSSIYISDKLDRKSYMIGNFEMKEFRPEEIHSIALKDRNAPLKGAVLGFLSGIGMGVIIQLTSNSDIERELNKDRILPLALTTGLGGYLSSLIFWEYKVDVLGKHSYYRKSIPELRKRAIISEF